jgi:hypothetical protein
LGKGRSVLKYFKHIELQGWKPAAVKIHKFVKDNTRILDDRAFWNILNRDTHSYCYEQLDPVFKQAGFDLLRISFLVLWGEESNIHQDRDFFPGFPERIARVNIPVLNCKGTETKFFSSIKWDPVVKTLPNGITYTHHDPENVKCEASVTIDQPTIIRVRELHQVINPAKLYPRITLTCALDPDPVYLLEEN